MDRRRNFRHDDRFESSQQGADAGFPVEQPLHDDAGEAAALAPGDQIEAAIVDAMFDVPVPPGLNDRIHAALAANETGGAPYVEVARSRRRWLAYAGPAALAVLAASAALVVLPSWWRPPPAIEASTLAEEALRFHREHVDIAASFPESSPSSSTERYPYPRASLAWSTSMTKAYRIEGLLGRDGVAYAVEWNGVQRGAVIVVDPPCSLEHLASQPPAQPHYATGGRCSAVWRGDALLCALIVEGGLDEYRQVVRAHRQVAQLAAPRHARRP